MGWIRGNMARTLLIALSNIDLCTGVLLHNIESSHPIVYRFFVSRRLANLSLHRGVFCLFSVRCNSINIFLWSRYKFQIEIQLLNFIINVQIGNMKRGIQCWTEGWSSTAVAKDLRPTATVMVGKVWGHFYCWSSYWYFS